jgi:hypothetical protein
MKTPWRKVLEVADDASIGDAEAAYRALAQKRHPDVGGSKEQMAELNAAVAAARSEIGDGDAAPKPARRSNSCENCTAFRNPPARSDAVRGHLLHHGANPDNGVCQLNPVPVTKQSTDWCRQHIRRDNEVAAR